MPLVLQRNTSYPIQRTNRTLVLFRLSWLLRKSIATQNIPDTFAMQDVDTEVESTGLQISFATGALDHSDIDSGIGVKMVANTPNIGVQNV